MQWALENLRKDDEQRSQEISALFEALKPWLNWDLYQAEIKAKEKAQVDEGYLLEFQEAGVSEEEIEQFRKELSEEEEK